MRVPLTPGQAAEVARPFQFSREWICTGQADGTPCVCHDDGSPASLRIRAKDARADGPSNFAAFPPGHQLAGHATIASGFLTWNGLAAERGWLTDPVRCPACRAKLSVPEYREARRRGTL